LNFFRGYSEGLQRFVQDKTTAKKIIQKYTRDTAEDIIEATYQYAVDYVVRRRTRIATVSLKLSS